MKKEIIEKYIKFGIDNGYKNNIDWYITSNIFYYRNTISDIKNSIMKNSKQWTKINIIELITSKDFIQAVANGLSFNSDEGISPGVYYEQILVNQAYAIAEGELELYIEKLFNF